MAGCKNAAQSRMEWYSPAWASWWRWPHLSFARSISSWMEDGAKQTCSPLSISSRKWDSSAYNSTCCFLVCVPAPPPPLLVEENSKDLLTCIFVHSEVTPPHKLLKINQNFLFTGLTSNSLQQFSSMLRNIVITLRVFSSNWPPLPGNTFSNAWHCFQSIFQVPNCYELCHQMSWRVGKWEEKLADSYLELATVGKGNVPHGSRIDLE